ncbi:MAG: sulfide/dihydroorotate dehydrogenase-like FAD/NAD-binding protein [Bacilli bacterium]|nr:sulfide/dihydroorotate dehydrogenase-like FAD/NAD-binding protein [Bacilli bacterium]
MYKILKKEHLAAANYLMEIDAPMIAKSGKAGQFVIVIDNEKGERIPLTIADLDPEKGVLTIVFQAIGASTMRLAKMEAGEELYCCVGPLGRASDLVELSDEELKAKKIVFIAGGVGIAPVYPQVKYCKSRGIDVDVIMGGRTKDLVFWEDKMKAVAANVYVATDDGSYGFKGNVCQQLDALIAEGKEYNHAVIIGPVIMMKFGCMATKKYNIPTVVSMNPIMVDGTGMCGACRLNVGGQTKFACVDGPEFDGHLVDFDAAMRRSKIYATEEGRAKLAEQENEAHGGCGVCGGK